jgi:uncharacterized Zn finger protein (UPF0148 family)
MANFCDNCGHPLGSGSAQPGAVPLVTEQSSVGKIMTGTCSSCGFQNISGEMFCQNCGVQLAPVASAPPPPPTPVSHVQEPFSPAMTSGQCPICGYSTNLEDVYCENCGAKISSSARSQQDAKPEPLGPVTIVKQPQLAICLVVRGSNAEIFLDMNRDEWLVGRSDPVRGIFPDVDLGVYGGDESGVSRRHARLVVQEDQRFISDLNSTNFTFLNGKKLEPGRLFPLQHGDEVRFGLLALAYIEEIAE